MTDHGYIIPLIARKEGAIQTKRRESC